jgi:lambda family phage minor tail protein L
MTLKSDLINLFSIKGLNFDPFYFCGQTTPITFLGNIYQPLPCDLSSLSIGNGLNDCQLTIANADLIGALVKRNKDLLNFEVTIWQCSLSQISSPNPLYQNPSQTFIITQKVKQTPTEITFKLENRGFKNSIPGRMITSNCAWKKYRGAGCDYVGAAMFTINNLPTTNPAEDACNLSLDACKLRGNTLNYSGIPTIDDL